MADRAPTMLATVLSWIGVIIIVVVVLIIAIYWGAEYWRTKKGSTRYYYAYGHNDCNVRFVTEHNYREYKGK